ncbi:hypothetical protein NL676_017010 [Syzygium grande]|nr:hypothetical protein NL676_017010 [Syzygium grande]
MQLRVTRPRGSPRPRLPIASSWVEAASRHGGGASRLRKAVNSLEMAELSRKRVPRWAFWTHVRSAWRFPFLG